MALARRLAGSSGGLVAVVIAASLVGCGEPAPSEEPPCAPDLPARTSSEGFPFAILHVNGDDLPPVVGSVEWTGDAEPVTYEPARPVHLQRYTVLQTRDQSEVSIRLTDDEAIAAWKLDAVPANTFRIGDLETGRTTWSEGSGPTDTVCVPIQDGSWTLIGELTFTDGNGSGTYYWRLNATDVPAT